MLRFLKRLERPYVGGLRCAARGCSVEIHVGDRYGEVWLSGGEFPVVELVCLRCYQEGGWL